MNNKTQHHLISVVCPFYNEEKGVSFFYEQISRVFTANSEFDFELVCIDDGSTDQTLVRLVELSKIDCRMRIIELSRNFGKESALTAGIDLALGDAVIPIDADLQDPPDLIPRLIEAWLLGAEVVLAHRVDRTSDSFFKRKGAEIFYRLHNKISNLNLPENVGDFRLMDRKVVEALRLLPERQRFMKGLFAWVGFKTVSIDYVRQSRVAGKTKFSGWRLWNFALEGVTSFSTAPLKISMYIGLVGAFITLSYAAVIVAYTLSYGADVPGYASLLVSVLFLGSLQLICMGILGEYIGRIYIETKQRPPYLIRRIFGGNSVTK